jgi:hypothetical protein
MALLDGILGGAQTVQAFGQQKFENKLATDKFEEQKRQYDQSYDESVRQFNINDVYNNDSNTRANTKSAQDTNKYNTEQKTAANDKLWKTYKTAGLLTPDGLSIDSNVLTQRVKDGDPVAEQVILGMATQFGDLPEGSKATEIKQLPNGGYAVTVVNADGSVGAVTEDGSSDPNSTVVNFEAGQLSRLAAAEFGMNVITDLSVFDGVSAVNQTDRFEADAARQGYLDKIDDLRVQRDTLNALPSGGLKRGATAVVANAETPEEANEVIAQIQKDTAQQPASPDSTVQVPNAFDLSQVDRSTKGGRLIAASEGVSRSRRGAGNPEKSRERLIGHREELANKIKTTEANRARLKDFKAPPAEKDGLLKDKAELAQIDGYLNKDQAAPVLPQSPENDSIVAATDGKTTEEVKAAVDSGEVQMSEAEQQNVARTLIDNEIKELKDLLRLNAKDQAIARVAILASEEDPTIRAQMSRELSNLFDNTESSPSMSRKDEIDDGATARTYRLNLAKYNRDVNNALKQDFTDANEASAKLVETTSTLFFGENGDEQNFNAERANMLFKGKALNGFLTRMKRAVTQAEKDQYMMGLNASISLGVAGLAGEQDGGISESIADFFVRGEVTNNNNPIDFDLRRVIANDIKNPTEFYYTDADGNKTDELIDAKELQGISESVYEIVREQAIANTPKPKGE